MKEGNVKFPHSWSGHQVTVFNPYHPRRLMWDATMLVSVRKSSSSALQLSGYGRVDPSAIVSEFGPLR